MDIKEFEAEFLRRMNALRIQFTICNDQIKIRSKTEKWTVKVLGPVEGDMRKCVVCLFKTNLKVKNGRYPVTCKMFEKPCTTYYLLQYITGYGKKA